MNMMTKTFTAALLAGAALAAAAPASAGVTGCSASGGKQEGGAVIGAVLGGLLGNAVGGRHAGAETVVGAAAGAAAGSAIGCEAQKDRADKRAYSAPARRPTTYAHGGYRLSSDVAAANYSRIGRTYVAETNAVVRSGPKANADRVGGLRAGERFEALAYARGTDWILVGRGDGVGIGYVRSDLVSPGAYRYSSNR